LIKEAREKQAQKKEQQQSATPAPAGTPENN